MGNRGGLVDCDIFENQAYPNIQNERKKKSKVRKKEKKVRRSKVRRRKVRKQEKASCESV